MLTATRILVADDHVIVRVGLMQMIKKLIPNVLLSEVDDYSSLFSLVSKEKLNLVILDVNMPNGTLQHAIDFIKLKQPELKILIFSSQDEHLYAIRYLKMGADGFLNKLSSREQIDDAISTILKTGRFLSDEVKDFMVFNKLNNQDDSASIEILSNRELEVANKLIEGLSLKELSNQLNLHVSTVSTYKNRIFEKLNIQSIPELIAIMRVYS
ncbi:response regulator transcription factor [Arenibacter certesii]|uniref:DNA-binding response regulator n=1 Tax=Arenibacter certesii TaxID=228955 RepID=A0A918IT09_9FLAO|nr:response regulator transcription factor [Arenibacter certesii]GGW30188.1 DNA-binding response regulator [Arenibacter certesii]